MAKNKKILLVVEDNQPLREVIKDKFLKEGFEVLEASDGAQGLNIFSKEKPDIILLDIIMPVMDGITMLKKLRRLEAGKKVPVIVLTNLAEVGITAEALEHGVHDYLIKSDWKLEQVVEKVNEKLGLK